MAEMTEAAKKARRDYIRKWRAEHPEKMKQYSINHWEHVAERQKEAEEGETDD